MESPTSHAGNSAGSVPMEMRLDDVLTDSPNFLAGILPPDIESFDFAELEDGLRAVLYGRGDWLVELPPSDVPLSAELGQIEDSRDIELMFTPYAPLINPALHCTLVNWLDHCTVMLDGGFVEALAQGLKNILVHGNSLLRQAASESLPRLK